MKKNLISVALAGIFAFSANIASAEDMFTGAWYILPGATYMNADNDLQTGGGKSGGGFIRAGKELSPHWDVQFGVSHAEDGEDSNAPGVSGTYKQTLVGVDALYMFSRENFRPFLLAGLGAARNNIDYSGIPNFDGKNTSIMANVGLGAQYLFTQNFGLQADLRHVWSRADFDKAGNVFGDTGKQTIGNTLFNFGGILRFGVPAPVVVAPVVAAAVMPEPTPEPAPAPPPPPPVKVVEPCKPVMETITVSAEKLFEFDKSNLSADSKASLDDAVAKLIANPDIDMAMVAGYTDRLGSDAYNLALSERRAKQVTDYMVSKGVAASRLKSVGKGNSEPVVACDGIKNRKALIECLQPNRRVVISAEKVRETGCK